MQDQEETQASETNSSLTIEGSNNLVLVIEKLLTQLAESTHQANFYAATKMRCGPKVRATMEYLMEKHDFTAYELGRAWNTGSLVKAGDNGNLKGSTILASLVLGWIGVVAVTIFSLLLIAVLFASVEKISELRISALAGLVLIGYVGGLTLFVYTFLKPTYIAKRVVKVLKSNSAVLGQSAGR